MSRDLVIIGKAFGTHGLKGALRVFSLTDRPDRFSALERVILVSKDGAEQPCTLESVRIEKSGAVISCREITRIEDAQPFVQGWVKIPASETAPLAEDQFFRHDLVGMSVYRDDGRFLGILEDVLETGSNDVFVVRDGEKEILIPALRHVVARVDVKEKQMTISDREGLTDGDAV